MTAGAFGSIEEAFAKMEDAERAANLVLHPRQQSINFGDYVIREAHGFIIWGYILEKEQRDEGEDAGTVDQLDRLFVRGYRYGRWHSSVLPEGEFGDAHISTMWPIMKEDFDKAGKYGWGFDEIMRADPDWFRILVDRMQEERANTRGSLGEPYGVMFHPVEEEDNG